MDPLSVTGTLIAVLQITTSVISVCYDYRAGIASASREVFQISESLNALKDVLEGLLRLIETSESGEDRAMLINVKISTVIEQLIRYTQQDSSVGLAYFYFDFHDTQRQDTSSLARCLISQLSSQLSVIPASLTELHEMRQSRQRTLDEDVFLSTLRSIILLFRDVYLIFDALDESSNCDATLHFIRRLKSWRIPQLHILMTSRQLAHIEDSLLPIVSDRICLHNFSLNKDVRIYLADKFEHDQNLARWPPDIRKQITTKLVQGEQGMFQWVVCQLDMLQRCLSVAAVREALSVEFPKDLVGTYDQILYGIQQSYQLEALKTLQAVVATVEPLTPKEIVDILAVDLDTTPPRFEADARLIDPRSIFSVCSSLITTTRTSQLDLYDNYDKPTTVLRVAHASVAEYFALPKPAGFAQFRFSHRSACQMLGHTCLVYLMAPEFGNVNKKGAILGNLEHYPFLRHAAKYWPLYLGKERDDPDNYLDDSTIALVQAFFATSEMPNGGNFSLWVSMLIPDALPHHVADTQPLYYAASFGLLEVVRLMLDAEQHIDIDALGGRARSSALHVAVYRDHIDVVRMLLDRGANTNLPNIGGESALYWASINGNQEMIDLLLDHGAKPMDQHQIHEIQLARSDEEI
ncbi:hypothetical protein EG329_004877 [Mollisiaceae sp. DMI_Dod_QoI]|nr:hypothetical protein EG329_004877 [Helotiales sp. DMI_Dod_QoI]